MTNEVELRLPNPPAGPSSTRRLIWRVVIWIGLAFLLVWGGAALLMWQAYHAAEYPGAALVAAEDFARYRGNLAFTRTESYSTNDPANSIYKWYSSTFNLGRERFAQGNCMMMARSMPVVGPLNLNMSVMVCSTMTGRLIFVSRTYTLRFPRPLRQLF